MAQSAESLAAKLKVLASFSCVVARLGSGIHWWPSLKGLAFKVNAIGTIFGEQNDLPAWIGVTTIDGLKTLRMVFTIEAGLNGKGGNRQRSMDHSKIIND